jgi:hypothetical protein
MFEEKKNMSVVSASDHSLYVVEKKNVVGWRPIILFQVNIPE